MSALAGQACAFEPSASGQIVNHGMEMYRAAASSSAMIAEVCRVLVEYDAGQAAPQADGRAEDDEMQDNIQAAASSDEERMSSAESQEEEELEAERSSSSSDDGRW